MGKVIVATTTGGAEQEARAARWGKLGVWESSPPDPEAIAGKAAAILRDRSRYRSIRERVRSLGIRNGLPTVLDAMESLLTHDSAKP